MEQLQVPTRQITVDVYTTDRERLSGYLFVADTPFQTGGPEDVVDVLNDERRFLPFVASDPTRGQPLLNKDHVVRVHLSDSSHFESSHDLDDATEAAPCQVVLADGQVVDTIIHGVAQPLKSLGPHAAAVGMYAFQSLLNFFIPSGSGQAYVTMPLMAPLADVVGVTRQTSVLAYQFGDGFTNILVPTNAVLVGILAMARIPYERWLRFVLPFMIKVWIAGSIALVVAVAFGY